MESEGFDLKWKNHLREVVGNLQVLREKDAFFDVALYCDGEIFRAHKVLLAACSSFFERLLARLPPTKSECIVLLETRAELLTLVLDFIYNGEVYVDAGTLNDFMNTAEKLEIRGLRKVEDPADVRPEEEREKVAQAVRKRPAVPPRIVGAVTPDVEIAESVDRDPLSSAKRPKPEEFARNGSVESSAKSARDASGARSASASSNDGEGSSSALKDRDLGRSSNVKDELSESQGDFDYSNDGEPWNDEGGYEDGYYGGGEGDDEQFQYEPGFSGGDDERPQNIPPEISASDPVCRWKPNLNVWWGQTTSGTQLYFCGVCGYSSVYNYNVKTHLLKHTGEKPYNCQFCHRCFRYKRSFKTHVLTKHPLFARHGQD